MQLAIYPQYLENNKELTNPVGRELRKSDFYKCNSRAHDSSAAFCRLNHEGRC